jgi:6,7-dimethyl-8-ribityllumazine synthase
MNIIEATDGVHDIKIAIVISQYNRDIVDRLENGCLKTLIDKGVKDENITVIRVPGAFEIPVTVQHLANKGEYTAIIALGAVIRGETPHFDFICNECVNGLMEISLSSGLPVIFGVLTVDNYQQALDRSGEEESNKGCEAATTALVMVEVLDKVEQ